MLTMWYDKIFVISDYVIETEAHNYLVNVEMITHNHLVHVSLYKSLFHPNVSKNKLHII